METEELLWASVFAITMAVLVSASVSDWKRREVSDIHWIVLGTIGLIVIFSNSVYLTGFRWEYVLLVAGAAMILLDILWDRKFNMFLFYLPMALLFIIPLSSGLSDDVMVAWASVPIYYLVYVGAYYLGIVRGGADVKCLVVLSIIFPMYPYFTGLPLADVSPGLLSHVFVLSVSSLFLAAVLAIPIFVYFVVRNARAGIISRKMASGYRMDISKAEVAFVWPLEDIVEGELTYIKIPKDEDISGIYSRLKEAGHETVWVTPMIPFVVLITIAVAVIVLIGDPLFLIA